MKIMKISHHSFCLEELIFCVFIYTLESLTKTAENVKIALLLSFPTLLQL